MGGQPVSALAVAIVPYASDDVMQSDLSQVMAGAKEALSKAGCALVGGHSAEGAELALGRPELFVHRKMVQDCILVIYPEEDKSDESIISIGISFL